MREQREGPEGQRGGPERTKKHEGNREEDLREQRGSMDQTERKNGDK